MKLLFKNYLKNLFNKPNEEQVISIGLSLLKILALLFIIFLLLGKPEILNSNGIWTLITAIISSPILFIIWRFRDQNATQQIENQRKDINLKEFQKIAEWVSGSHLIEEEITDKLTNSTGNPPNTQLTEKTIKYTQPNSQRSIPTFSKRDGAIGLQIAAIYNLLPFFQGKHGEDFRKPALNLLTSAWLALQQQEVLTLEQIDILKNVEEFKNQIKIIQKRANSPIGIALTEVLLSDGGNNLLKFPEVFPNLNLAGMNFHLPGLDENVLSLFQKAKYCQGINLIGAKLANSHLDNVNFKDSHLEGIDLSNSKLQDIDLLRAHLEYVNFSNSNLTNAILQSAHLEMALLNGSILKKAHLSGAKLYGILLNTDLQKADLEIADLLNTDFIETDLTEANLQGTNLAHTTLTEAKLLKTNFEGSIILNTNTMQETIKSQGGVVLYLKSNNYTKNQLTIIVTKKVDNFSYTHSIYYEIDLEKTRQENPDWEINVEIIEEE